MIVQRLRLAGLAIFAMASPALAIDVLPAPPGDAAKVATAAIREAGHPCPRVKAATRDRTGGIRATCTNGEVYLVSRIRGAAGVFAMRCSAARKLLNVSC